jgi:hypothetical protein
MVSNSGNDRSDGLKESQTFMLPTIHELVGRRSLGAAIMVAMIHELTIQLAERRGADKTARAPDTGRRGSLTVISLPSMPVKMICMDNSDLHGAQYPG